MTSSDHSAPELIPFELRFRVGDETLAASGRLPNIPIRVADFLPVFQSVSNAIAESAQKREARAGREISCRAGCGACCNQPVPIAPSEAIRLAELVQAMPDERRTRIEQRFKESIRKLNESGLMEAFENLDPDADFNRRQALGLHYFRLRIPCPFLENEQCSIHPDRPLACREYSVTSPAKHCANPSAEKIRMAHQPLRLSNLLFRFEHGSADGPPRMLLLIQALNWAGAETRTGMPVFPPEFLFQNLTRALQGKGSPGAVHNSR